jgi:phosphodiesterase/alkaline phosphatase D-like protein
MLLRILKTIKDNPGKKILVVTGDAHAEMFEVYSKNETEREFKIKSFLYEIAYKPQKLFAEITTIK